MKTNYTNAQIQEMALAERFQLKLIFDKLNEMNKTYLYELELTSISISVNYDAMVTVRDKFTNQILKRYLVEHKNRTEDYSTFVLEQAKLNRLKKDRLNFNDYGILYINSSPLRTYIWDLDDKTIYNKIETKRMNNATYISRDDINKRNKKIYRLDTYKSIKMINLPFKQKDFDMYWYNKQTQSKQLFKKETKTYSLF